jgi:hypothetical protein
MESKLLLAPQRLGRRTTRNKGPLTSAHE